MFKACKWKFVWDNFGWEVSLGVYAIGCDISITLEEKEDNEVVVEAFSYVGARKVKAPPRIDKRCVREVLKIVDKLGFTYRILDEIDYFYT